MFRLLAASSLLLMTIAAAENYFYDSKYDNFDVDSVISNDRLMKAYAKCFLNKGKCTPDGTTFKKLLPEALESGCAKCSIKQKSLIRKVIKAVQTQLPEEFVELRNIYDPEDKYVEGVTAFLEQND